MNSGIGGMSSSSIDLASWCVTIALMPGSPPSQVARCSPGLPTVATLMCSCRLRLIASIPKKVKNRLASMPSMRAPLAMIRPGYTPSSEPLEMMIETFSMVSDIMVPP